MRYLVKLFGSLLLFMEHADLEIIVFSIKLAYLSVNLINFLDKVLCLFGHHVFKGLELVTSNEDLLETTTHLLRHNISER